MMQRMGKRRWRSSAAAWHVVRTEKRLKVPTCTEELFCEVSVPLTLTDVHLRHEELPFAYFFHETLDQYMLLASLKRVLERYPVVGGTLNLRGVPSLELRSCDFVPVSIGYSPVPLSKWLQDMHLQQHVHRVGKHPKLLPIFDDLVSKRWAPVEMLGPLPSSDSEESQTDNSRDGLATVRITYPQGGGTILGVNICHALADAASCFRLVEAWGREMQGLAHPRGASNQRSHATCSGMISPELAEVLDLKEPKKDRAGKMPKSSWTEAFYNLWGRDKSEHESISQIDEGHEYAELVFSADLLRVMKAYAIEYCLATNYNLFLSTNDMVTAFCWLLKRHLSGQHDWNMSIVVNLRGRGGVDAFSLMKDEAGAAGVFGNGITNVVAALPVPVDSALADLPDGPFFTPKDVAVAAVAIRDALSTEMLDVSERVAWSRMGKARIRPSGSSFATTSWQQFQLWDISFASKSKLAGFHGHPSQALPAGESFTSVVVPRKGGSCSVNVLAPIGKAEKARKIHQQLCTAFSEWNLKRER